MSIGSSTVPGVRGGTGGAEQDVIQLPGCCSLPCKALGKVYAGSLPGPGFEGIL